MQLRFEFVDRWEGVQGLGDEIIRQFRSRAENVVLRAILHGSNEMKRTLTGQRTGRTYRASRKRRSKMHTASAPGEPPAVLWGNLRNSVGWRGPVWDGLNVYGEYGPGLGTIPSDPAEDPRAYAVRLEYGGIDSRGVYIAPRPYMAPTEERIRPTIEQMMEGL